MGGAEEAVRCGTWKQARQETTDEQKGYGSRMATTASRQLHAVSGSHVPGENLWGGAKGNAGGSGRGYDLGLARAGVGFSTRLDVSGSRLGSEEGGGAEGHRG